jgi:hypothetical protein
MLSPELAQTYPRLKADGGKEKSPKTSVYNCVAWAAAWDKTRWWQHDPYESGMYWPDGVSRSGTIGCYIALFESLGYQKCGSGPMEVLYERVAIYENAAGEFTHVAKEKHSGIWWSKLGEDEDVYHNTPNGLAGTGYGSPNYILRRRCGILGILARVFFKLGSYLSA